MELLIVGPQGKSTKVELDRDFFTIGRGADNDLAYPDDWWLSRRHLRFERDQNGWIVRDCKARNGTVVNATSLRDVPHKLRSGDRIYAGHLTIEVRDGEQRSSKELVAFVPQEKERSTHEQTIVTSLDRVLDKATNVGKQRDSGSLGTARSVKALIRAGQELAGHQPLKDLFGSILNLALTATEAKRGVILTLEGEELEVQASRGEDFRISTAVRDRVIREKCSVVISDAQIDKDLAKQESILLQHVRSMMAVPLQTRDRVIGLIYVDNAAVVQPFSPEDLDLLTVMANVAAIRIEHARLAAVEESEKLMEYEWKQASEIQQSLLPLQPPDVRGYDLAGYNLPCRGVGGDYYDFLPYKDGRLGLVVGDVSGKGLPAAVLMSGLQARVQMLMETQPDPATAVRILNSSISERCPSGKFITFFYALLDPETGHVQYSNAGHNYPLVIRADGRCEQLKGNGIVLGVFPSVEYPMRETALQPGDMLALYSDGVTEAVSEGKGEFGENGLAEFLKKRAREAASTDVIHSLVQHLRAWTANPGFMDDFTILLVRREA